MKILLTAAVAALSYLALTPASHAQSESLSQSLSQIQESDWHPFSNSAATVYLADVGMLNVTQGVTSVDVAKVPRRSPDSDQPAYRIERYQYRCDAGQFRSVAIVEYNASGEEIDRFDEGDAVWEAMPTDGLVHFLSTIACEGHRNASRTWGSIAEFIAAGKPE